MGRSVGQMSASRGALLHGLGSPPNPIRLGPARPDVPSRDPCRHTPPLRKGLD